MNAKEILSHNKKLLSWWNSIVGDPQFDQMMLILKADSFEASPDAAQMRGVSNFIASMTSIISADSEPTTYASSGLNHDLDVTRRTVQPPAKPEKPNKK